MTTHTDGAELRFTHKAGPATSANPALASEPGIVKINGKDYRITLEVQVNGAWKKVDPNHIPNNYLTGIANQCQEIYQITTQEAGQPTTLTVYFEQKNLTESWISAILGKFSNHFKEEVVDLTFKKIEYKTAGSDELHVVDVQTHQFSTQADAVRVNQLASEMRLVSKAIFSNREGFIEQPKKIKPKSEAEANSEKLAAIKRTLNVQEAGSRENRCMTLSIAAILLKNSDEDLQELAEENNIPFDPKDGETPQVTLSNGLIELAATTIETDNRFTRQDTEDNPNRHFSAIVAALRDARQVIADETDRPAVVKQYATLIRRSGQMLDIPVLNALEIWRFPIITLIPSNGDLVLGSVSNTITFDERSLDTYDLTTIYFVVLDGLHYQPVMMDEVPNAAQQEKLRSILKNDMNKTLGQIQNLITDQTSAAKSVEFNNLVRSVVNKYPIDAKPRIVQMLIEARRTIDNDLISQRNDRFIARATAAFLSNPGPIIEEIL